MRTRKISENIETAIATRAAALPNSILACLVLTTELLCPTSIISCMNQDKKFFYYRDKKSKTRSSLIESRVYSRGVLYKKCVTFEVFHLGSELIVMPGKRRDSHGIHLLLASFRSWVPRFLGSTSFAFIQLKRGLHNMERPLRPTNNNNNKRESHFTGKMTVKSLRYTVLSTTDEENA